MVFQVYGPLQAWGDPTAGENRTTYSYPSKSGILGLLAAALGIPRDEEQIHRDLSKGYGIAVRVDASGMPIRDYHTVQVGKSKRGCVYPTRRDELQLMEKASTVQSYRDYRVDALYTICVWCRSDPPPYRLQKITDSLSRPRWVTYLGRKSCPPAVPFHARVVESRTLAEAFAQMPVDREILQALAAQEDLQVFWDEHPSSGIDVIDRIERRDVPTSRRRWQFEPRWEYRGFLRRGTAVNEDVPQQS